MRSEDVERYRKLERLKDLLNKLESVCIAFSGGVDSTFLTRVARDVLGERVLAVTAQSPTFPRRELNEAIELAAEIGVRHLVIESEEMEAPGFKENRPDRCYYCKKVLFERLRKVAHEQGLNHIVDGSNYDDIEDYRPGRMAAKEMGILSPLLEAKLTKADIRFLSKILGMRTWDKPSFACLSSRIPYNTEITIEKLLQVENAEEVLRGLGFSQFRLRHHNEIARIEVPVEEFSLAITEKVRSDIVERLKALGFLYVTLDLMGYRTGSMNEVFEGEDRAIKKTP